MTDAKKTDPKQSVASNEIQDNEVGSPDFAWPTVVAVVVTHNPGDWLEQCLTSVSEQEYPDLTTLVVDVCSDEDITKRVANSMPKAFVRRLEEDVNFAEAVNLSINSIEGATYVLVCHDDVVLGQNAITEMVEEAFLSNASIVGPKLLDADNQDQLLEVGGMIDRFGVPFSGIEPDEVDQGQHDGVRDVFFVSSATMLVRADLFRALGGFDVQCFPGAEDIDIAWRAHLVGARVLVQPDAVVKHHETSDRQKKFRTSKTAIVARHRMRAVLKNSSKRSLMWILPLSFILHTFEGIIWLVRFDPKRSWLLFSGWIWNIKNLRDTLKQRKQIQKTREVSDRVIASHQVGGSARFRRFATSVIRNRQLKKFTDASRSFATSSYSKRTRETPIYLTALIVYLLSVRSLFIDGLSSVGEFVLWPSFSEQVSSLFKGGLPASEYPMVGSTFGRLIALVTTFSFGMNEGLAQTFFTVAMIPIGCYGVRLLLKEREVGTRSVAIGAVTYGMLSFGLQAFANGDFGAIVLLAGLPYFLRALANRKGRQAGFFGAVVVAFCPASIPVLAILGFFFLITSDTRESGSKNNLKSKVQVLTITAAVISLLNVGIIFDLIRNLDRSAFGISDTTSQFSEYLFSNLKLTIVLYLSLAIIVTALIVVRKERSAELRLIALCVTFLFGVTAVAIHFAQPVFEVSVLYVMLQLCVAISIGVVFNAFDDELKLRSLGIFHLLSGVSTTLILVSVLLGSSVLQEGRFGLANRSWANQIEITKNERVLYLGDSRTIPGRSILAPLNRSFSVGDTSSVTFSRSFAGPASPLDEQIRTIYSTMMASETSHAGYLLARLSIGVVAVPNSRAPGTKELAIDAQLLDALNRQTDLVRLRDRQGMAVFKNTAFETGYSTDKYAQNLEPSVVLENRFNDANSVELSQARSFPSTSLVTLAFILFGIFALLMWPRRFQLLNSRPLNFSSKSNEIDIAKAGIQEKILDLEGENEIDETNGKNSDSKNIEDESERVSS